MKLGFNEVKDVGLKFAGCALGKSLENTTLGKVAFLGEQALAIAIEKKKCCPIENGEWIGERGESKWCPDKNYIPKKANPEAKNWSNILDKCDIQGINFKDGEPLFECISKGTIEIKNFSEDRSDNFDKADIALAKIHGCMPGEVKKWRKEHGYTWHECRDMKTMQKVPSIIHNNISHSGGISQAKKGV